jgi:parallel beta-helix repeat protein
MIITILLSGFFVLSCNVQPVKSEAKTWTVDDDGPADFHSIQEAINAAANGDTIYVKAGTYFGDFFVNKTLSLIGENRETTIFDGKDSDFIHITENNITLRRFMIEDAGIGASARTVIDDNTLNNSSIECWDPSAQPQSTSSNYAVISNNILRDCFIYLLNCSHSIVSNNTVTGEGIYLPSFSNGVVSNNSVRDSPRSGIMLTDLSFGSPCYNNSVNDNTVTNCDDYGIGLEGSGNILRNNAMIGNDLNLHLSFSYGMNDIDASNTVDGKPVYFFTNQHDLTINPSTFPAIGYLTLINCTNVTVTDLPITDTACGINCTNVTVKNLRALAGLQLSSIVNSTFESVDLSNNNGFSINEASNCTIRKSVGQIILYNSSDILATENNVSTVDMSSSVDCTIDKNMISEALLMTSCNGTLVVNNDITQSGGVTVALFLYESNNNTIVGNNIHHSHLWGLTMERSNSNIIYHNNFINNTRQLFSDDSSASWDKGHEGNYWSGYKGQDMNRDGIGDTPYTIDWEHTDNCPLMRPYVDVNFDGRVNIIDIFFVAEAFGSKQGDEKYNLRADIVRDDVINIVDIFAVAAWFGHEWQG